MTMTDTEAAIKILKFEEKALCEVIGTSPDPAMRRSGAMILKARVDERTKFEKRAEKAQEDAK
jgi:hypothetical protein